MSYKNMGELVIAFATNPVFDADACKLFLYYISELANRNVVGLYLEWDFREVLTTLGISKKQYDSALRALSQHGFVQMKMLSEYQQMLEPKIEN